MSDHTRSFEFIQKRSTSRPQYKISLLFLHTTNRTHGNLIQTVKCIQMRNILFVRDQSVANQAVQAAKSSMNNIDYMIVARLPRRMKTVDARLA